MSFSNLISNKPRLKISKVNGLLSYLYGYISIGKGQNLFLTINIGIVVLFQELTMDEEYALLEMPLILLNMPWAWSRPIQTTPPSTRPLHQIFLAIVSAKHRPRQRVNTSCTCHVSWWGSIVLANVARFFLHRKILPNLKFFSTQWWKKKLNSGIFFVFHDAQCYPEYLITFYNIACVLALCKSY